MARENRRERSGKAIGSLRVQPAYERVLTQNSVPVATNPLEGLTAGGARLADRMEAFGGRLASHFNDMSNNLMKVGEAMTKVEIAQIEEQKKDLKLQAALDHAKGSPYSSDDRAYTYARKRLETMEKITEISAAKAAAKAAGKKKAKADKEAAEVAKTMSTMQQVAEGVPVDAIKDGDKALLGDLAGSATLAAVKARLEGASPREMDVEGVFQDAMQVAHDELGEISDPDVQAKAYAHFAKFYQNAMEKKLVANATDAQKLRVERIKENTAVLFRDDNLTADDLESSVSHLWLANGGDLAKARQDITGAVMEQARISIEAGDVASYNKAMKLAQGFAKDNPLVFDGLAKQTYTALATARKTEIETVGNQIQDLIAGGDVEQAVEVFSRNRGIMSTNDASGARRELIKAVAKKAEEDGLQNAYEGMVNGSVPYGMSAKDVNAAFEAGIMKDYVEGDMTRIIRSVYTMGRLPNDFEASISATLTNASLATEWLQVDENGVPVGGPGLAAGKAYALLKSLPDTAIDKLPPSARAIFYATKNGEQTGKTVQQAMSDAVASMTKNHDEFVKAVNGGWKFRDHYGGTEAEAEAAFDSRVGTIASDLHGATVPPSTLARIREDARKAIGMQSITTNGVLNDGMIDSAIRGALAMYVKAPSQDGGETLVPANSNPNVARKVTAWWDAAGDGQAQFKEGQSKVEGSLPMIFGVTEAVRPSLTAAPSEHAVEGWMAVTGGDQVMGQQIVAAAGGSIEYLKPGVPIHEDDRPAPTEETFKWSGDNDQFHRQIAEQNAKLFGSGFAWLPRRGLSDGYPQYYLAFRPKLPVSEETSASRDFRTEAIDVERVQRASVSELVKEIDALGTGGVTADRGREYSDIVKRIVRNVQNSGDSIVPGSIGKTIQVPDRFDSSMQAIGWLEEAVGTYMINHRAARPFSKDRSMPDTWNAVEFLNSRHGNRDPGRMTVDPMRGDIKVVGAGVPVDQPWVREFMKNELKYTDREVRAFYDGAAKMPKGHLEKLNIAAFHRAEDALRNKVDSNVLTELPWDAYMTIVDVAHEDPAKLNQHVIKALNERNWKGVELALRTLPTKGSTKTDKDAQARNHADLANLWAATMGITTSVDKLYPAIMPFK